MTEGNLRHLQEPKTYIKYFITSLDILRTTLVVTVETWALVRQYLTEVLTPKGSCAAAFLEADQGQGGEAIDLQV